MNEKKGFWARLFGGNKSGGCCNMEIVESSGCCEAAASSSPIEGTLSIKVLGSGCASCHTLLGHTETAVKNMGLSVTVEYITDMKKIMEYGVMNVPALVVNEKVVSTGKVLKTAAIEKLLAKLGL